MIKAPLPKQKPRTIKLTAKHQPPPKTKFVVKRKGPSTTRRETSLLGRFRQRYVKPIIDRLIFGHIWSHPFSNGVGDITAEEMAIARRSLFEALRRARSEGWLDAATPDLDLFVVAEGLRIEGNGIKDALDDLASSMRRPPRAK